MPNNSIFIKFLFFVLIIRTYLAKYGIETTPITLFLNFALCFMLFQSQSKQKAILLTVLGVVLSIFNINTLALLDTLLFAYLIRKENLLVLSKFYLKVTILFMLLILLLNHLDIIKSGETFINYKGDNGIVYAGDFGMQNPNTAGQLFFVLSSIFCIVYNDVRKISNRILLCLFLFYINYLAYNYTYCRTAFLCSSFLFVMYIIMPFIKRFEKINRIVFSIFPFFTSLITFYITYHYYNYMQLDEILTRRFSEPGRLLTNMGVLQWLIGMSVPGGVDTSYMVILFSGGIITFIFLFYKIMKSIWDNYIIIKELEPVLLAMFCYGIAENIFSSCNPLSVIFYSFIFFPRYVKRSELPKRILHSTPNEM